VIARHEWADLIPHQGAMSLLDAVVDWDDTRLHATAVSHRDPANPLRSGGMLRAVHLCEYAAQATAIHGALVARRAGARVAPGLLVALREVELHTVRIDDLDGTLRVDHAGARLAAGRVAILYSPPAAADQTVR